MRSPSINPRSRLDCGESAVSISSKTQVHSDAPLRPTSTLPGPSTESVSAAVAVPGPLLRCGLKHSFVSQFLVALSQNDGVRSENNASGL
jgi:hypothetical protein